MKTQDCKKKMPIHYKIYLAHLLIYSIQLTFVKQIKQIDLMHLNVCPNPVLIKKREKRERI